MASFLLEMAAENVFNSLTGSRPEKKNSRTGSVVQQLKPDIPGRSNDEHPFKLYAMEEPADNWDAHVQSPFDKDQPTLGSSAGKPPIGSVVQQLKSEISGRNNDEHVIKICTSEESDETWDAHVQRPFNRAGPPTRRSSEGKSLTGSVVQQLKSDIPGRSNDEHPFKLYAMEEPADNWDAQVQSPFNKDQPTLGSSAGKPSTGSAVQQLNSEISGRNNDEHVVKICAAEESDETWDAHVQRPFNRGGPSTLRSSEGKSLTCSVVQQLKSDIPGRSNDEHPFKLYAMEEPADNWDVQVQSSFNEDQPTLGSSAGIPSTSFAFQQRKSDIPGRSNDAKPDDNWEALVHRPLNRGPPTLGSSAGNPSCCIYKVSASLGKMNRKHFDPKIFSIGPYHSRRDRRGQLQKRLAEERNKTLELQNQKRCNEREEHDDKLHEHKARYLDLLLTRPGLPKDAYINAVNQKLDEIKSYYSESIEYADNELVHMIVTDGCFIIEMFRMVNGIKPECKDEHKLNTADLFPFLLRDFMLLENQIPFFVLQLFFDMSKTKEDDQRTLIELDLNFFNYALPKPLRFQKLKVEDDASKVKHLLDLLRLSITQHAPMEPDQGSLKWDKTYLPRIPPATKLHLGGISIKRRGGKLINHLCGIRMLFYLLSGIGTNQTPDKLINIGFDNRKGWLKIPTLILDDFVSCFLSNCVAYESCHDDCTKHFSTYVTFMRCLTNKEVENYLGTDADVVDFFKNLTAANAIDIRRSYLADVCYGVNIYYESKWHQTWAELWNTYFSSPWSIISVVAVSVGLLLTAIQTYYNVFPKK